MLWADIRNVRSVPVPGLRGTCPICAQTVIARCGTQRVHHWAHLGERTCDRWWEPETQWHRSWKLMFPESWHECVMHDENGEKHIADVRMPDGLVIEFQHSHLCPGERAAREKFYRDMIWLVDGTRLQRDLPRFIKGAADLRRIGEGVFVHAFADELFPKSWLGCSAPVFFDFGGPTDSAPAGIIENSLWCLLPQTSDRAIVVKVMREAFVSIAHQRARTLLFSDLRMQVAQQLAAQRARDQQKHLRMVAEMMQRRRQWHPRRNW